MRDLLDPYTKNKAIYICPSNIQTNQTQTLTYSYNWCVGTVCGGPAATANNHGLSQFALPSQVPAFVEANNTGFTNINWYFAWTGSATTASNTFWGRRVQINTGTACPTAASVLFYGGGTPKMIEHLGGSTMLFVDGHAKWSHSQTGLFVLDSATYSGDPAWYTGTTNQPGPPSNGIDYFAGGTPGTATAYD